MQNIPILNGQILEIFKPEETPGQTALDHRFQQSVFVVFGESLEEVRTKAEKALEIATEYKLSFRDIIKLANKHLSSYGGFVEVKEWLNEKAKKVTGVYPAQYLLFDGILCWLDGDFTDAHLFFEHAFKLGIINIDLYTILLVMIKYSPLCYDCEDYVKFMKLLGLAAMPASAGCYVHFFGPEFERRIKFLLKDVDSLLPWLRRPREDVQDNRRGKEEDAAH